jgi:hypothetical protein
MKKCCGDCIRWQQEEIDSFGRLGSCRGALNHARKLVPFAIDLDVGRVYSHGGRDCPCFEKREPNK